MKLNESLKNMISSPLLFTAIIYTSIIFSGGFCKIGSASNSGSYSQEISKRNHIQMRSLELNFDSLDINSQVQGCKIYDENANCLFCIRDQYLASGVCTSIAYSRLIQNCNVYFSETECFECDQDYRVSADKKTCNLVGAVNGCRKWRNVDVCILCASGFFLQNGNCFTSIANCIIPLNSTSCLECASGFGILDETLICKPITSGQSVEKCARYNNNACIQCLSGFALDLTNKKCLPKEEVDNQIDENCVNTVVSNDQHCNICRQGFFLDRRSDGSLFCNTLNARDESCYIIDFTVRENCLVCMPNFEIQNKKCIANIRDQPRLIDPVSRSSYIINSVLLLSIGILISK